MNKQHATIDKVENGFWIRYRTVIDRGETIETIVFETYKKMEDWLNKYLEKENVQEN